MTETPAPNRRFLTIEQVAQELNVSEVQIRALLRSGDLRGIQVGGRGVWRIGVNDVEDFIAEAYRKTAERIAAGDLGDPVQGMEE
ncbi:helix-turn-helix domain-containing protein [Arthrobacter sp. E44]|uniref:helix-turn-helix domain-containing protein n=1 Tax=Arthrobacter sp. E44 TaxID=3341794 RepID=UPI0035A6F290